MRNLYKYLLIIIIFLFGLHLLMDNLYILLNRRNRCRCNGNTRVERFSISADLRKYLKGNRNKNLPFVELDNWKVVDF